MENRSRWRTIAVVKTLIITKPSGERDEFPLEGDRVDIGRSRKNDLSFPQDTRLSRRHLALEREGEDWWAVDQGSRNGTFVNGALLSVRHRLNPGDRLVAGRIVLVYLDSRMDSREDSGESVVFYPGTEDDAPLTGTMAVTLKGLLEAARAPAEPAAEPALEGGVLFQHPAVSALIRAGRELSEHRPLKELFRVILDLAIQAVGAERGVLFTLEENRLKVRARHGEGFRISTTVRDQVLESRTSLLVRDTRLDEMLRERQSIDLSLTRTMMAVPLQTEDQVFGLVYVDSGALAPPFTADDLNLLTVLANVAAIRVDHARLAEREKQQLLVEQDLARAAEIQRGLLPEQPPSPQGLELAAHSVPCRTVGGDYYDFFTYPDGRVALVLGDVSGKGISAALLMTAFQARVQVLAEEPGDLARMMERLNRILAANCPANCFISFFFGLVDPSREEIVFCNAGHNPPLLQRASGEMEKLEAGGPVLGVLPEISYTAEKRSLGPGDLLLVFSDGVTEAQDSEEEEFGEERLAEVLAANRDEPADAVLERVKEAVADWTAGVAPFDDLTLVAARVTP